MSIRGSYRLRYINIMQKEKKKRKQVKYLLFCERVSQKTQLLLDAFSILIVVYIYHWALSVE